MDLRELTNGAALAGAARNFGLEVDELVDFAIKTAQKDGLSVQAVLQKMVDSDLEMQTDALRNLGLDKYEDVLSGSEAADNSNFISDYTQEERDKGYQEGKEDKRLRKAARSIAEETRYRAGDYTEEGPEFEGRKEYRQSVPTDPNLPAGYDPELDDFVVKKKGRIIRFKKQGEGNYRPTNEPGGVIKRRMVKYRPGDTQKRYDPKTRQNVIRTIAPEPFYPGARNEEPFDATVTGKPEWASAYEKLSAYIDSGQITDPQELKTALDLKENMKTSLDPGYAKAKDFDRGVALVKQDRQGLPEDEINRRIESDLRAMTANGEQVRPFDQAPVRMPDRPASNAEIQAIRQAAILRSIHDPTSVEPAMGRRNAIDAVGVEAALRTDYGRKPSESRRQFNNTIALRDSIINETEGGNFANDQLGRIGEVKIQGKGYKRNGKPDWVAEAPIDYVDPSTFPDAYRASGPITEDSSVYFDSPRVAIDNGSTGNPLSMQGPMEEVNTPSIGQTMNSPESRPPIRTMEDLLIAQQFSTRESGIYPQTDISGALNTFNSRVDRLRGIAPGLVGNAGTLDDVQSAVDVVLGLAADKGVRLNEFGSKKPSADPGPMEVLARMRYTGPEVQQLSNALLQLELGKTNGVNSLAKSQYFEGSGPYMANRPIGLGQGGVGRSVDLDAAGPAVSLGRDRMSFGEIEQMSDYTVGDNLEFANQRVAPAFRALTGENIEGTRQERRETLADARRPYIGQIKGEIVPIDGKQGNPNYRFNATGETDPVKIESAVRDQARARASAKNPRSLTREEQNIYNAQIVNARHYPDVVKVARAGPGGRRRNLASLSRNEDVLPSTAGAGMGGGTRPPVSTPGTDSWQERPGTSGGLTTYNPPSSKSRSSQGADDSEFRQRVRKRLELGQRARAGAAIAGGVGAAIAGIDGLIGGERNKREEAQY